MKDKEKAGTLKEVITQISHSKKWPIKQPVERNGKTFFVNAYSLLQDRYYEHMRAAGFEGFERGERGSTAEHLSDLEFKSKKENERLAEKTAAADAMQNEVDTLDGKLEKKQARLDRLTDEITVKEKAKATIEEVEAMGHSLPLVPGVHFSDAEAKKLKTLAKKSVTADDRVKTANKKRADAEAALATAERDRDIWKNRYNSLMAEVKDFLSAIRNFPQRLKTFIDEHWRERRQQKTNERGL